MIVNVYVRGTDRRTGAPVKHWFYTGYASKTAIETWQAAGYLVTLAEAERGATV